MREQRGVGSRDRLHSRHPHLRYNIFKYTNIFSQPNKPMHTFHHFDSHSSTLEVFIKTKTHREIIYLSYSLPQFWTIPVNISVTCGVSRFTIGRAWRPSRQQWLKLEEGNCIWRKVILNSLEIFLHPILFKMSEPTKLLTLKDLLYYKVPSHWHLPRLSKVR